MKTLTFILRQRHRPNESLPKEENSSLAELPGFFRDQFSTYDFQKPDFSKIETNTEKEEEKFNIQLKNDTCEIHQGTQSHILDNTITLIFNDLIIDISLEKIADKLESDYFSSPHATLDNNTISSLAPMENYEGKISQGNILRDLALLETQQTGLP